MKRRGFHLKPDVSTSHTNALGLLIKLGCFAMFCLLYHSDLTSFPFLSHLHAICVCVWYVSHVCIHAFLARVLVKCIQMHVQITSHIMISAKSSWDTTRTVWVYWVFMTKFWAFYILDTHCLNLFKLSNILKNSNCLKCIFSFFTYFLYNISWFLKKSLKKITFESSSENTLQRTTRPPKRWS